MKRMTGTRAHDTTRRALARTVTLVALFVVAQLASCSPRRSSPDEFVEGVPEAQRSLTVSPTAPTPKPLAQLDKKLVERVVVIGASLSAGFGLDPRNLLESRVQLAHIVDASIVVPHEEVESLANGLFFANPEELGKPMIEEALATQPTLLVALDWLFWFGFGIVAQEEARPARLEIGLAALERFTCPILVGDLPDEAHALRAQVPMLVEAQIPSAESMLTLNTRIRAWAAAHANVVLVPLAETSRRIRLGETLEVRGNTWKSGSYERLMQRDELHPTLEGATAVWVMALDTFLSARNATPAGVFLLEAAELVTTLQAQLK